MDKLYAFDNLKKYLKDLGYAVESESRIRVIKKDFKQAFKEERIKFSSKGMMYKNDMGEYIHVYAYLENYSGSVLPKFHVIESCNTISRFINEGQFSEKYSISNSYDCKLQKRDSHEYNPPVQLEICENCLRVGGWELLHEMRDIHSTADFNKKFNKPQKKLIATNGYTVDWIKVREREKQKADFICEHCRIDLRERPHLLDVHHIDNFKANNKTYNLEVVCVKCHSQIDKEHKERFKTPIEQTRLWELEEYKKHIKIVLL